VLTDVQRLALIDVARTSVAARVTGREMIAAASAARLPRASGVFVTLKLEGVLRGCLGTLACMTGLEEEVARCAADSASADPRFSPVTPAELPALSYEVSVLGPLERLHPVLAHAITIGVHGLVIEHGRRRGVLLPQVAFERRWTADQFLRHACLKADLPSDAWARGATVYVFVADVFGDRQ
jgi:AmmeMemoRadiSam system protein A